MREIELKEIPKYGETAVCRFARLESVAVRESVDGEEFLNNSLGRWPG